MRTPSKTSTSGRSSPPYTAATHPPRQQRSAATEDKLLQATIRLLDQEGFDAATVPRIAALAGFSPAALYRRFADKDDLLRAALLRVLDQTQADNARRLQSRLAGATLAATCERVVAALLKQYRAHPRLLQALVRVLALNPASAFSREAMRRISANLTSVSAVLLAHKDSIRHPDPQRAVRFAVLSAASAIEGIALGQVSLWHTALPLGDTALAAELTRQMLAYLRRKP